MTKHAELYGLKNCDSCRRAQRALEALGLQVTLHDIRETPTTRQVLRWIDQCGDWSAFLNKRSTTWRNLRDGQKVHLDRLDAISLMREYPTLIKRPVIRIGGHTLAGFKADVVDDILNQG